MANITATFGTTDYKENGVVVVPVTFEETVIAPPKTVFNVTHVSGDPLQGIDYRLIGKDTAYALVFAVPPDRSGRFQITANGDVLSATGSYENVTATPITVNYGTLVPRIIDYDIPANYSRGSPVDIFVAYNIIVTGWNANNAITQEAGIFELEGANLGTPSAYKWIPSSPPNFESLSAAMPNLRNDNGQYDVDANTAALRNLGWQGLATPPAGSPTPGMNGYDNSDPPIWHGEPGKYFLIRFANPQEVGIFNLRERIGIVRGPIS